jgi:hypothetical protein
MSSAYEQSPIQRLWSARSRLGDHARTRDRPWTDACRAVCRAARYHRRGGRYGGLRKTRRCSANRVRRSQVPERPSALQGAVWRGWPRRLVLNRRGAGARRERLLRDIPTRAGFDRDEYPPAVGRGRGRGLERGRRPRGWKAVVRFVPRSETGRTGRRSAVSLSGSATAPGSATRFAEGPRAAASRFADSALIWLVSGYLRRLGVCWRGCRPTF